jgi:putative nucleotidyltransferase with HDIG domain
MLEITKYNKNLLSSVAKLKSYDEYTFEHSINVGIFASSLAKHIGLPEQEVEILTLSGILHDTGKMLVPSEILNKPGKLTDEEFKIMKSHVIKGYDYLLKQGFDKESLKIVIEHHERYDGSGYPYGLSDKDISLHGKIGAVVDIYDAITSDRVYHKGMQAAKALKLMFNWSDSHIDKKVFEFFVTHIGIYPVGTLLMLNTNELALVGKYENNSLNPIVVIFINPKGKFITPFLVDLSKKSVVQRKVIGPVNPETVEIPEQATKMVEEMNSSLS